MGTVLQVHFVVDRQKGMLKAAQYWAQSLLLITDLEAALSNL